MAEWLVQLNGHEFDLLDLTAQFRSDELRVIQDEHGFWLRSADFDTMAEAGQVLNRAREHLQHINGAARVFLGRFQPVTVGHVLRVNDDGSRNNFAFVSANVALGRARVVALGTSAHADGAPTAPPPPPRRSDTEFVSSLAQQDAAIAKALRLFGLDQGWATLYKVFEVVQDDVGGRMFDEGWTTKEEARRFKHTANSVGALGDDARHGVEPTQSPKHPMSLQEAQALVRSLLQAWMWSKRLSSS